MSLSCDVLIVGGGPAGSSAAMTAARSGAKTILIEKQKEISQVPCAEGIGSYLLPLLPFKIPKNQLKWKINGIFFSTGDLEITRKEKFYQGWSIERKEFDRWLLNQAKNAGAKILMNTKMIDIECSDDYVINEVAAKQGTKEITIKPSYVIAADGVDSTVADKLGLLAKKSTGYVHSWEMKNLDLKTPHMEQMYLGDFAPGAYGYIFPKAGDTANIGVGNIHGDKNLERNFNTFVEEIISSQTKNAIKTIDRCGKGSVEYDVPKCRYGNVVFTGDAANQNFKPYIEGILPGIICGDIAGKSACSKGISSYEKLIKGKLGRRFKESDKILEGLHNIDKLKGEKRELLNLFIFAFLDADKIDELVEKDVKEIREEIIRLSDSHVNSFVTELYYYLWYAKAIITHRG